MKRALLLALPLLLLAFAGCVTTGADRVSDPKEASKANVDLGVAYLTQGNLKLAKEKLERAQKQDPKSPNVYWAMASLYESMEQPKDADQNYRKAVELAPTDSRLANTYAVFLCRRGEVDRALPLFDKVISDKLYTTPYAAAANAGMCLRDGKRNADAQRYFERALVLGPGFADAAIGLSDLQLSQGDPVAAMRTVDTFVHGGNKSADVLVVGVRAAVAQRDCSAAQKYALLLRRDAPNGPQTSTLPQLLGNCGSVAR